MRTSIILGALLVLSSVASAKPGAATSIAQSLELKRTRLMSVDGANLYTIEHEGALYATPLATGKPAKIGAGDFTSVKGLYAGGGKLVTLDKDGSLYTVNPADGVRARLGKEGEWTGTQHAALVDGALWSVETGGQLVKTDLASGARAPVGKPAFGSLRFVVGTAAKLFAIDGDGSLHEISADGTATGVGKKGDYRTVVLAAATDGKVYTIESDGTLYTTDVASGKSVALGRGEHRWAKFLLASDGKPFTLETDGTLSAVALE